MQLFIDSADISEIKALAFMVDGVTTNPSLIAKTGRKFFDVVADICAAIDGPVSAEVTAIDADGMVAQGYELSAIAKNVVVKLPSTLEGIQACRILSKQGIATNVTLCFSPTQALLAAKAGATYISPFIGRLDDIGQDGMQLIQDILQIYDNYPELETQVLAASIRHIGHVREAALCGAHVATVSGKLLRDLINHPLTDIGLKKFMDDWKSSES
jgi:transaldolase